jgi:aspartyl-tRNA(Asn)/glutamyl-tRNA(Gln) amidotransferase subunit B
MRAGFVPVIGLELHAQLSAARKLFSPSANLFAASPNTLVSALDSGFPGALPRLNWECVDLAARTGLALGCVLHRDSVFDRKHYFYADQPAGYQITQQRRPLCTDGAVQVVLQSGQQRVVRIARLQMEQDTGKMIHEPSGTLLDLNRCGAALVEIVSHPDMRSADEAVAFVTKVARLLQFIGTCDADMSKGNLRVDVNVSVAREETIHESLGTRCEIKNINSLVRTRDAIEYEVKRHIECLTRGEEVVRETRGWNTKQQKTFSLRDKETAKDYRFMRDPDLPMVMLTDADVARIRASLTETPTERVERYSREFGLNVFDAEAMALDPASNRFFEAVMKGRSKNVAQVACNWITHELTGLMNAASVFSLDKSPVTPQQLGSMVDELESGAMTGAIGKRVLKELFESGDGVTLCRQVLDKHGWAVVRDNDGELERVAALVVSRSPQEATSYRQGDENRKQRMLKFFMGQAMKETKGRADPEAMRRLIERQLAL